MKTKARTTKKAPRPGSYLVTIEFLVPDLDDDKAIDALDQDLHIATDAVAKDNGVNYIGVAVDSHTTESDPAYKAWRKMYGKAVDSDNSISCGHCDVRVEGDSPDISIVCWPCFKVESA